MAGNYLDADTVGHRFGDRGEVRLQTLHRLPIITVMVRLWTLGLAVALLADAQIPAQTDLPYIKQASTLIPTETAQARKEGAVYVVDGAESRTKTPLSLPIFFIKADKLVPDQLQLHKMESKGGRREFTTSGSEVLHMEGTKLASGVWKVAVADTLEPGEYVLTAGEPQRVFCFQVF